MSYAGRVNTVSVGDVVRAIDEARGREPGGVVAFDGDGTLWSGDVGDDFFHALLEAGVHEVAHDALVREAAAENVDTSGGPRDVAARIHSAYLAGKFPEDRVCEIMTWVAAGRARSELDHFCSVVVETVGLRRRLHAEAVHIVEHARSVGVEVFLVSASPRAIVEQAAKLVGIDVANTIAIREVCDGAGVVQTSVERPISYGPGKVTRLRDRIGGTRVLYAAFGDNAFDVPMLCASRIPVAVRPKSRLLDRARDVPELVVLAHA